MTRLAMRHAVALLLQRGIVVVGVLWVLGEAKQQRFEREVRRIIDELLTVGRWLHPERVIRPFLEALGEPQRRDPYHIEALFCISMELSC